MREIGSGTHYTLYQAVDPRVGRMVVVKILHVAGAPTPEDAPAEPAAGDDAPAAQEPAHVLEARLQREAHSLASLSHPNVLAIYDTGEQDGYPFLVMEYLHGHPLRQHLDCGPLPLDEALDILENVAAAVDAVHDEGILHRDIRPSSVMLLHDGRVKLMDFGLARHPGDTTVTLMGTRVGEPAYMAPELLRHNVSSKETDFWSLGVLLYEMLAGQPPFHGPSFPIVAHQVVMAHPAPIPGVSAHIQAVVDRALEKDPNKRFRRAGDLVQAFRKAVAASPTPTVRLGTLDGKALAVMAGCGLGLAAAIAVGVRLASAPVYVPPPVPTAAAATLSAPPVPTAPAVAVPPGTAHAVLHRYGNVPPKTVGRAASFLPVTKASAP